MRNARPDSGHLERDPDVTLGRLALGFALGRRFDAVHHGIANQLDEHVLDRTAIGLGHLVMAAAGHDDLLAMIVGDAIRELLGRRDETFAAERCRVASAATASSARALARRVVSPDDGVCGAPAAARASARSCRGSSRAS
jgi:hypothetical protein